MKIAGKLLGLKKKKKKKSTQSLNHLSCFCGVAQTFQYKEPVIKSFKHQKWKAPVQIEKLLNSFPGYN